MQPLIIAAPAISLILKSIIYSVNLTRLSHTLVP